MNVVLPISSNEILPGGIDVDGTLENQIEIVAFVTAVKNEVALLDLPKFYDFQAFLDMLKILRLIL